MKDIFDLIGRLLIAVIFYFEAYDKMFFMTATRKTMSDNWHNVPVSRHRASGAAG